MSDINKKDDFVLLHGWGMRACIWDTIREKLVPYFNVHAVDLPGYGTTPSCSPYTLDQITNFIARKFSKRVYVCGWSLGSLIAQQWALNRPGQIERLILIAATPCFISRTDWQHGISPSVFNDFALDLQTNYTGTLKRFFALQTWGNHEQKTTYRFLKQQLLYRESRAERLICSSPLPRGEGARRAGEGNRHGATAFIVNGDDYRHGCSHNLPTIDTLEAGLRILLETDLRSAVPTITQPTLIINGDRDTLVPIESGQWFVSQLPKGQLTIMRGHAHAPFLSGPDTFVSTIINFIQSKEEKLCPAIL